MNSLIQNLDPAIAYALGWTIIHSLWQASLAALIMSLLHKLSSHKSASFRYGISVISMVSVFVMSMLTFGIYYSSTSTPIDFIAAVDLTQIEIGSNIEKSNLGLIQSFFTENLEHINLIWGIGVILFLSRFIFSYAYTKYLRHTALFSQSSVLEQTLDKIKNNLMFDKAISIAESAKIKVPLVIGHVKPLILFPVGIVNVLSIEEVEAIITHELAHIRRYDYLTNIMLTLIEILFYFHPAVWWISANVKAERENCCDDFALSQNINKVTYAKALVKLEEIKSNGSPALAMSFSSKKHLLINRIKRIMNMPQTQNDIKEKSIATILLMSIVILFSTQANSEKTQLNSFTDSEDLEINANSEIPVLELKNETAQPLIFETETLKNRFVDKIASAKNDLFNDQDESIAEELDGQGSFIYETDIYTPLSKMERDTLPNKHESNSVTIITEDDGKSVEIKQENGEITMLKIDGKEIPESEYDNYQNELDSGVRIYQFDGDNNIFEHFNDSIFSKSFGMMFDGNDWREFGGNMGQLFEGDWLEKLQDMEGMRFDFKYLEDLEGLKGLEKLKELRGFEGMEKLENLDELFEELGIEMDSNLDGLNFRFHNFDGNDGFDFFDNLDDDITIFRDPDSGYSKGTVVDKIGSALNRDGLLKEYKSNKVEITGKHLKINGEKMPKALFEKYKNIYQETTGAPLTKGSKMKFEVEGKPSKRKVRTF